MRSLLFDPRPAVGWRAGLEGVVLPALSPALLRAWLLAGCALSVAIALSYGSPDAYIRADRELAFLLRGMAVIKASLVIAGARVLWWRFAQPIAGGTATAYLLGAYVVAAATGLIWQLTLIAPAALAFHVGAFILLFVAYRDRGKERQIRHPSRIR